LKLKNNGLSPVQCTG